MGRLEELSAIAAENGGILKAEDVVEYAKDETTALHKSFEWDDTKAGQQYRIWQARCMIRVVINQLPGIESEPTRVFVSLLDDRKEKGGGYRLMLDVLNDDEMRKRMVTEALIEFKSMRVKYGHLKELVAVFEAIDKVQSRELVLV